MEREARKNDIPGRQLLVTSAQPGAGMWKDLGEAKITHSIFGRAKVRIVREQDKIRRALLLTALAVMAIAAAVWQGWGAMQQTEPLPATPVRAKVQVSAPAFQPEYFTPSATLPSVSIKPEAPSQTEINKPDSQKNSPQQSLGLKASEQIDVTPVAAKPLKASKRAASLAANNNSSKNQADMQQPSSMSAPIQSAAPTVAAPPAASSSGADPFPDQLIRVYTAPPSPASGNQPTESTEGNAKP